MSQCFKFNLRKSKLKILILGYSNIAKKRFINYFINKKFKIFLASKSTKENISIFSKQYNSYQEALDKSDADLVYISLPNSLHFIWAHKALSLGYHVVVDKPLCNSVFELNKLIKIAFKKKKLLAEAIFFNYHKQFRKALALIKEKKNIKEVCVNFTIPKPKKNTLLASKKFKGGALMDMGPYAAAIARIFFNSKMSFYKIYVKKDKNNLIKSFKVLINFKSKTYSGEFKFGGSYKNNLTIITTKKTIILNRVFSPPSDENLKLIVKKKKEQSVYKIEKDDCFEIFFNEVLKNIKAKKYNSYISQLKFDNNFRNNILKK